MNEQIPPLYLPTPIFIIAPYGFSAEQAQEWERFMRQVWMLNVRVLPHGTVVVGAIASGWRQHWTALFSALIWRTVGRFLPKHK